MRRWRCFGAFGSIALLMLVDFSGLMRSRLETQAALSVAGAALICLGTLASQAVWSAVLLMAVVAFIVIFLGVVSSVIAGSMTALLLAFILPAATKAPLSAIPDRLAGWGLAAGVALLAVRVLWPAPERLPLRAGAAEACRTFASHLSIDSDSTDSTKDRARDRTRSLRSPRCNVNFLPRRGDQPDLARQPAPSFDWSTRSRGCRP